MRQSAWPRRRCCERETAASRETQIARAVIRRTIQAHLDAGTKPTLQVLLREIVEAYNQEMGTTFNVAGFLADRQLHPTGLRCGAGGFASGRGACGAVWGLRV